MSLTIFKNSNVWENIPEQLFFIEEKEAFIDQTVRDDWFSKPPKYTTVRINPLLVTVQEVEEYIKEYLSQEAIKRELRAPGVYRHDILQDCLVVTSWSKEEQMPRLPQEVVVDTACGAAVLRGANVFAPGVLGMMPYTQTGDLVSVYADSCNQCKRGLCVPFIGPGKVHVGNGIVKMSRKSLFQKDLHPKGVAVEVIDPVGGVASVDVPRHMGMLQNLPSIVCGHVLGPRPGDKVIDLCAAPGHKTTHLAALMGNSGVIVALDKIPRKVAAVQALCDIMGTDCVKAFTLDSTKAVGTSPGPDWSPPYCPESFDRVLLDAPCSALGQRPQIGSNISTKQLASYPKLQRRLFSTAVQLLKPDGSLVYSTCTLTTQENEDIVSWALHTFPDLKLESAQPLIGRPGLSQSSLSEADCQKVQRFGPPLCPTPEEDTIGFFIAKFTKVS